MCLPYHIFNGNCTSIGSSVPLNLGLYTRKSLSSTSIDCILYRIMTCPVKLFIISAAPVLVARYLNILGEWPVTIISIAIQIIGSTNKAISVDQ